MTDRNVATITVTVAEYAALDAALACVHAVIAVQHHTRFGQSAELESVRDTLRGLVDRVEHQAAA